MTAMKILVAAIALAVAAAAPAFADPGQQAQAKAYGQEQTAKKKVVKAKTVNHHARTAMRSGSPYSTNPAYDVYVNGNYAGSDPDPRIRASLRKEYCEDALDGC
jgi:hypothetical protein